MTFYPTLQLSLPVFSWLIDEIAMHADSTGHLPKEPHWNDKTRIVTIECQDCNHKLKVAA